MVKVVLGLIGGPDMIQNLYLAFFGETARKSHSMFIDMPQNHGVHPCGDERDASGALRVCRMNVHFQFLRDIFGSFV